MTREFIFVLLGLLNSFSPLQAQTIEKKATISYSCVFNVLFERGQRLIRFDSKLLSEDSGSVFFSTTSPVPMDDESNSTEITIQADTMFRVVKDFVKEGMIFGDLTFNGKEKFYRDTLHVMNWEIGDEKKMIDSLLCTKATTYFKGRNYTAWFCPAIPIPNGPWKLGGLPGLIIEAYEDQKDLYFLLSGIHYSNQVSVQKIQETQNYPDYNSFMKYWKNFFKKLNGSLAAQDIPGCVSCLTKTKTKVYTWEKIPF